MAAGGESDGESATEDDFDTNRTSNAKALRQNDKQMRQKAEK